MAKDNSRNILKGIRNLTNITRSTSKQTTGISRDIPSIISDNVFANVNDISKMVEDEKNIINNHMSRDKLSKEKRTRNENIKDLYSIINDEEMMTSLSTMLGDQNYKFSQTLKDYEIIRRCIPQIHKVLINLRNSIISPDAMADSAIGIEFPSNIETSDKDDINKIIEKYKLNSRLSEIVMDYLISGVRYETVVPYKMITEMLKTRTLQECITDLNNELGESITLLESSGMSIGKDEILTESIDLKYYEDAEALEQNRLSSATITSSEYKYALQEALNGIEFVDGGLTHFKKTILNEAIAEIRLSDDDKDKSMKTVLKKLRSKVSDINTIDYKNIDTEGMVDLKTIKDIEKNVNFKGCHIEELDPSRTIAFKLRDTLIGYFYVEDRVSPLDSGNTNMSSIMDKINASVYMKHNTDNKANKIESMVIKSISERLISSVDAKFLNDNYKDMDIIYEFVKVNELHKKNKRVTFFHPDDVCEYKRKDGSIMANALFMAKLYLLTLLTDILANVTRGSDRQMYYVKTGLTTDVEGSVNSTIRAIKQNQVRFSDIGTINDIFNVVGSMVDVFMPVSSDGERPIETETIAGQNVDMNNDFLQSLLKSIIQSFGCPSSIIDDFENIEFAKTVAMSNLDVAKLVLDAQNELNEPLTKEIRLIISYELPEFDQVNEIVAKLAPPSVIIDEMNRERLDGIMQMAEVLVGFMLPANGETPEDRMIRKFKELYARKNLTTLDWDAIDNIVKTIKSENPKAELEKKLMSNNNGSDEDDSSGYDNY